MSDVKTARRPRRKASPIPLDSSFIPGTHHKCWLCLKAVPKSEWRNHIDAHREELK